MISPGPCHGDTKRYQVLSAVLLLLGRDVVTIGKWLQTSLNVYLSQYTFPLLTAGIGVPLSYCTVQK